MKTNVQKQEVIKKLEEQGKRWLEGENIAYWELPGIKKISFLECECGEDHTNQFDFIRNKSRYSLYSGGRGCGKSAAMLIKVIMLCLFFPGNRGLLGRETLSLLETNTLQEFFDYRVWQGTSLGRGQ